MSSEGISCKCAANHTVSTERDQSKQTRANKGRVERSLGDSAAVAAGGVVLEVVGAALGGVLGGATGLCLGWLAAQLVQAYAAWPLVVAVTRGRATPTTREDPR